MDALLEKLKREMEIRNFSKQTIKGYLYSVEKFLELSKMRELNECTFKDYIQKILQGKKPASVNKDKFAIQFFFSNVLHQKTILPTIKKNTSMPEILTIEEIKKTLSVTTH